MTDTNITSTPTELPANGIDNSVATPAVTPPDARQERAVFFSFHHPDIVPGGAQAVAHKMHLAHLAAHGPGSSLFIAAMSEGGPNRPAGSNLVQVAQAEFVYVNAAYDYVYFTNFDESGQKEILRLLDSFAPDVLHFHHFMGFGLDFIQACLTRYEARSVFTVHEHLLVCHNDGHLVQRGNGHVCKEISFARCATCLPQYRYDYFHHRMRHFARVMESFDQVTAVSAFSARLVGEALGLKKPIHVIPNGPIGMSAFTIGDLTTLRIAFIGQIHRTKGLHLLLQSVLALVKETPRLASQFDIDIWGNFVGNEEYKKEIGKLVEALVAARVQISMNGPYDAADLKALLHDRNVVVVPSLWPESYCLTADEALQQGKLLVCSDFPALRERYSDATGILYFPLASIGGLKMRLRELLSMKTPVTVQVEPRLGFGSFNDIYKLYAEVYKTPSQL